MEECKYNKLIFKNNNIFFLFLILFFFIFPYSTKATIDWDSCRVENGFSNILSSQNSKDITLNTSITNLEKSFLLLNYSGDSTVSQGREHLVSGYIKDVDTLTFERYQATSDGPVQFSYSLVECFNDEFTVQRGAIDLSSSVQSNTADLSTAINVDRTLVLVSAKANLSSDSQAPGLVMAKMTDADTVGVKRYTASAVEVNTRYEVVEFSASSNVSVQTGSIDLTNNNQSVSDTITSVNLDRAFVYCSWDAGSDGLQQSSIGCKLEDSTTITAYRHETSNYDNNIRYYVVEFPVDSINVQSGIAQDDPDESDNTFYTQDIKFDSVSQLEKSFYIINNTIKGTSNAFPRNKWIYAFTDTDNIEASFYRSHPTEDYDSNDKYWQVIEFIMDVPNKPSITSTEDSDRNPDLASSVFSGTGTHTKSDWKIVADNNCITGEKVWQAIDDNINKTSITVNNTNGTFVNDLDAQTQLSKNTIYYACVRYASSEGDSIWSDPVSFNTNQLPSASSASIDGGVGFVVLIPNNTKNVSATVNVTDNDSCLDISQVTAKFYRTSQGESGEDNNNHRYSTTCTLSPGTCTGVEDLEAEYECDFNVYYYADPTDPMSNNSADNWSVLITPEDDVGDGSTASDTIEINSLSSLSVSSANDFGNLSLSENTGSNNQTVTIKNTGNINIDINVAAYGENVGDNRFMICDSGFISASYGKYSKIAFNYNSAGTAFSSSSQEVNMNINKSTGVASTKDLYLGLGMPASGAGGSCSGNLIINSVADVNED